MPPGLDASRTLMIMLATSPLLVLVLYFVNRELAGSWVARGAMLFLLAWKLWLIRSFMLGRWSGFCGGTVSNNTTIRQPFIRSIKLQITIDEDETFINDATLVRQTVTIP